MGTYIRPSIKKDFVCCHPTQIFQVGRLDNMHVVLFFLYDYCCCLLFLFEGGGNIEFLWMAFLYLSFTAVTFHFAPPLLFLQAFLYLKIYIK